MDSNVNNNTTTTSNVLQQNNYQYNLYSPFYSQNYYYNTNNENISPNVAPDQQTYNNYPYYNNYQSYYNSYPTTYLQPQDEPVRTNTPDKPIMNDSGVGVSPDVVSQQASQQESDDEDFSNASIEQIVKKSSNSKSSSNLSLMKPPKPYLEIIADAILTTSDHMMQLHEIYQYMESKFAYFAQNVNKSWRNSVRHNLSLNECFVKAGRGSNGKGNYWKIHGACEQDFIRGNFRRKNFKILIRQQTIRVNPQQKPQPIDNALLSLNLFNSQLQSNFFNVNHLNNKNEYQMPKATTHCCRPY